jgi:mediator of RNA polymerase II transcription subunit 14
MAKFGPDARAHLFIQLQAFSDHYLVIVITESGYKYALVELEEPDGTLLHLGMRDIGWLDTSRINQERWQRSMSFQSEVNISAVPGFISTLAGHSSSSVLHYEVEIVSHQCSRFGLEAHSLRELYAYCWYV